MTDEQLFRDAQKSNPQHTIVRNRIDDGGMFMGGAAISIDPDNGTMLVSKWDGWGAGSARRVRDEPEAYEWLAARGVNL